MKKFFKGTLLAGALLAGTTSFAQVQDEDNVTVTMELVPILQLNMNTPDQVNFVFDEISEYIGGITQYGATILTVSSTVNWDLFASGTSGRHQQTPANRFWDNVVQYSGVAATATGATPGAKFELPLTALELRQFPNTVTVLANQPATPTQTKYYQNLFTSPIVPITVPALAASNNIYVSAGSPYVAPPAVTEPYIAGGFGAVNFVDGRSYLTVGTAVAGATPYYFVIDYRIVPGLPAVFPFAQATAAATAENLTALNAAGAYAKPGVYTMNVKYLLIENQ